MSSDEDLLAYYQQELAFIRRQGAAFAEKHPKIASRLRLSNKTVEDPHVERLIQAFAFANARIRHKLDDEFPEISDALLNVLHPHYLAPVPAMSLIQLTPDYHKLQTSKTIPANTLLFTNVEPQGQCYFTTRYPVDLLPIKVRHAALNGKPLQAPIIPALAHASAVLRLSLSCTKESLSFSQLEFDQIPFFINAQPQFAYALYEALFNNTLQIALATSPKDAEPLVLSKDCLAAVGFAETEGMLPYSQRTFMGYRLLTEFFAFPEKFLFFTLKNLSKPIAEKFTRAGENLEIYFYLNQLNTTLEKNLDATFFALFCTPIVNLFEKSAEPFALTHTQSEYHLVPDMHEPPQATEIYSIKRVVATSPDGERVEYQPFYGVKRDEDLPYYYANRKPAWESTQYVAEGTEVFLSFTDLQFNPAVQEEWVISADVICTNRDLTNQIPFGGEDPHFSFVEQTTDLVKAIKCLLPITSPKRPFLKDGARWRYVSHLSLNHLSLTNDEEGIAALRSLLKLYEFDNNNAHQNLLEGLLHIQSLPATARNPNSQRGNVFWQGSKIILQVDESKFTGTSIFLFGCILERFFALYATINSFTELSIATTHRGEIYRWKPRAGDKALF